MIFKIYSHNSGFIKSVSRKENPINNDWGKFPVIVIMFTSDYSGSGKGYKVKVE